MGTRKQLQMILETILGSKNVYFQPPSSVRLKYPCIIYHRNYEDVRYADDISYARKKRYTVTVVDRDPDSLIPDKIADLPMCKFERFYTSDNLNHDVYNLYY